MKVTGNLFLFLFFCASCFAQTYNDNNDFQPTKFDKFILDKDISWAAYTFDSVLTTSPTLAEVLLSRFGNKEIKVSLPLTFERGKDDIVKYQQFDSILKTQFPPGLDQSSGAQTPYKLDSQQINTARILFIEDGRLYAYVPWISTRIYINTSNGFFVGMSEFFSTAINYDRRSKSKDYRKSKLLLTISRTFNAKAIPSNEMLKSIYGRNMIQAIWDGLKEGKVELTEVESGKIIPFGKGQNMPSIVGQPVQVPVYDSLGNIKGYQLVAPATSISRLSYLELKEEWYYNKAKNKVYCRIPEIILFEDVEVEDSGRKAIRPIVKIKYLD